MSPISFNFYKSSFAKIIGLNSEEKEVTLVQKKTFAASAKEMDNDNLESISTEINKKLSQAGIKAEIIKSSNGYKLHLVPKNSASEAGNNNQISSNPKTYSSIQNPLVSLNEIPQTGTPRLEVNEQLSKLLYYKQLTEMSVVNKPYNSMQNSLVLLNELPGLLESKKRKYRKYRKEAIEEISE